MSARVGAAVAGLSGAIGALMVIVLSALTNPIVAIGMPVLMLLGTYALLSPFVGLALLAFFSHLDGLSYIVFAPSPVSGFKLLSAVTLAGIFLTAHQNRKQLRLALRNPVLVLALLFGVAMMLSALGAQSKGIALDSMRRLFSLILLLVLFVILVDSRARLSTVVHIVILTSLVSATILILDIALGTTLVSTSDAATTARTSDGFDRSSGASQYNPTTAATMLLTGVVIALVALLEGGRHRPLYILTVLIGSLGLVLSFARSSALIYMVILVLLAWRYRKSRYFPLGMLMMLLGGAVMLPFVPAEYFDRIASILDGGGDWTLGRRLTYNIIGLDLVWQHPVFGVGPGNFKVYFVDPEYRYLPGRTLLGRQLHNMYLSVIVEYGIFGAVFFLGFCLYGLRQVRRVMCAPVDHDMRVLATAFFYGYLAYLLVSVFVPNEYNKYTWMLAGIAASFPLLNNHRKPGPDEN